MIGMYSVIVYLLGNYVITVYLLYVLLNCVSILLCNSLFTYSASVGRSATFCALKIVVEQVKTEGIIDVFYTVHTMRTRQPLAVRQIVSSCIQLTVKFALIYASRELVFVMFLFVHHVGSIPFHL